MKKITLILSALFIFTFLPTQPSTGQSNDLPTSRDPVAWPFRWDSIWNMPIGDGAIYVPANIRPATQFGVFADEDVLILEPDAPLVNVIAHNADWDPNRSRCDSIVSPTQILMENVPIPFDFSTDPGVEGTPNQSAAILMPDGVTIRQTQPLHRCGAGGPVVSQYNFQDDNIKTGDGIFGAHGGSVMSSMGGTIRMGELVPGSTLRHALKIVIDSSQYTFYNPNDGSPGYRWPASVADTGAENDYGGSVPELEMGALLALKPNFNVEDLRTEPAKIMAQALIDYGGYLVDSAGWDAYYFATEWGPDGRMIDEFEQTWGFPYLSSLLSTCTDLGNTSCLWSKDMTDLFTNLHVIDNNSLNTIGGPGIRRQPCAPPFNDGTGAAPEYCERSGVQPSVPATATPIPATATPLPTLTATPIPTVTDTPSPPSRSSCTGNLLTNASFEEGLNGWNNQGNSTLVADAFDDGMAVQVGLESGGISQNRPTSAGERFHLSGWAKVSDGVSWSGIGLAFYDADWNRLLDLSLDVTSSTYAFYNGSAVAPTNAAIVDVWSWNNGGGHLRIDGFCLARARTIFLPWVTK